MEINLRKAKALQEQILSEIKNITLSDKLTISEFSTNPESEIKSALEKFNDQYQSIDNLYAVYYNIRAGVAEKNSMAGISDTLANIAFCEKMIGILQSVIPKTSTMLDFNVIEARLNQIKSTSFEKRTYGFQDYVNTSILDEATIKEYETALKSLKRQKIKAQESLLNANVVNKITLSEFDVNILKKFDLI